MKQTVIIYRVAVPVPLPVKETNCYVFHTDDGWIIIDAGMDTPAARQAWEDTLTRFAIRPGEVRYLVVTHCHPDHLGLAAWLSERVQVPVSMMSGEIDTAIRYLSPDSGRRAIAQAFFASHGVPTSAIEGWQRGDEALRNVLTLPETWVRLTAGQAFTAGRTRLVVLEQGGHTDHQSLIYLPEENILFTGDQVLSRISPNVSLWPDGRSNPLKDYLTALEVLAHLPHPRGLAAHEAPLPDVNNRIDALMHHHQQRNQFIEDLLKAGPVPAYALVPKLFTRRPLDLYESRFAVGEILAHLEYLRAEGRVSRYRDLAGVWCYQPEVRV